MTDKKHSGKTQAGRAQRRVNAHAHTQAGRTVTARAAADNRGIAAPAHPSASPPIPTPSALPPILLQNADFVVLNKPAGLPVHAGPRGGASVEDFFPLLSRRRTGPWLAHRLDTDTSGCLVIALRRAALLQAQAAFATGQARKTYWAIVHGCPAQESGVIEAPLRKHSTKAGWRMVVDANGDPARTEWRLRGSDGTLSWIEVHPRTGRTHQVRAHLAALGHPIVGDPVYGPPGVNRPRLHLLARGITLLDMDLHAPPPAHMRAALGRCGMK